MPLYDYRCEANGRTIEVSHGMGETIRTWGALCERAGIEPGGTPRDAPVEKAVSLGLVRSGKAGPGPEPGACGASCGCHPR